MGVFHGFSQVGDSYYKVVSSTIQSMGRIPLPQSIKIQNLAKSPFSNVDLVWKYRFKHRGQNKVAIETTYIPHAHVFEFLQDEWGNMHTMFEWNISNNLSPQKVIKKTNDKKSP